MHTSSKPNVFNCVSERLTLFTVSIIGDILDAAILALSSCEQKYGEQLCIKQYRVERIYNLHKKIINDM